jgi:hypothetical protein
LRQFVSPQFARQIQYREPRRPGAQAFSQTVVSDGILGQDSEAGRFRRLTPKLRIRVERLISLLFLRA